MSSTDSDPSGRIYWTGVELGCEACTQGSTVIAWDRDCQTAAGDIMREANVPGLVLTCVPHPEDDGRESRTGIRFTSRACKDAQGCPYAKKLLATAGELAKCLRQNGALVTVETDLNGQ